MANGEIIRCVSAFINITIVNSVTDQTLLRIIYGMKPQLRKIHAIGLQCYVLNFSSGRKKHKCVFRRRCFRNESTNHYMPKEDIGRKAEKKLLIVQLTTKLSTAKKLSLTLKKNAIFKNKASNQANEHEGQQQN